MSFEEWLDEIEVFSMRRERFLDDLDHHKVGSNGSYDRMIEWLKAAYEQGKNSVTVRDI